jgi:CheY-like chemotaxis protein
MLAATSLVASVGGHVSQAVAGVPGWVGGAAAGLIVGVVLRLLDPTLKVHGERLRARLAAPTAVLVVARARRVLVVDDHEASRVLIALALREALPGVHVDEVRSGAEARGLHARYHHGAIVADLVLADEMGDALLRAIGGPGDVLVSGVADVLALDGAAATCGAVALQKPLAPEALVAAVTARLAALGHPESP